MSCTVHLDALSQAVRPRNVWHSRAEYLNKRDKYPKLSIACSQADGFIEKPFDISKLLERVAGLIV